MTAKRKVVQMVARREIVEMRFGDCPECGEFAPVGRSKHLHGGRTVQYRYCPCGHAFKTTVKKTRETG